MEARAYAGGGWKDAQKQAEHYWRDTKGGLRALSCSCDLRPDQCVF